MEVTFILQGRVVVGLKITPGASSGKERAKQLTFAANVRQFVLNKDVDEIALPDSVGEEKQLTDVFRRELEELRGAIPQ